MPHQSLSSLSPPGETELFEESLDESPQGARHDRASVQLESRGVTSHYQPGPRTRGEQPQQEFWESRHVWSESLVAKLDQVNRSDLADQIRDCHSQVSYRRCNGCAQLSKFYNRCDRKWCPLCTPRLAAERRESVEWWTREVGQPKHVVLTSRNTDRISAETVRNFKAAFARLRRSRMSSNWRGGFYSLEVTNEGRGWHLHLHALVDARYIDARQLAITWAKCIGQDFSIVKVRDARDSNYLAEVTKYAVKGSQLASWNGEDVAAFIDAFSNVRTFGVFGSLYAKRTEWRTWLDSIHAKSTACDCGCTEFSILSELDLLLLDLKPSITCTRNHSPRPPEVQLSFSQITTHAPHLNAQLR